MVFSIYIAPLIIIVYAKFIYQKIILFSGVVSLLDDIATKNDLGHPLCGNLRNGHWLCDYLSGRLKKYPGTKQLGDCLEILFAPLKDIPRFLVPSYFEKIVTHVYNDLINHAHFSMSP